MSLPIPGWPEKKEIVIDEMGAVNSHYNEGFNSALSLCEDALRKACEEGKIQEVLAKIQVPFKDFCPCDYTEIRGQSILIIKHRITDVIAQALRDYLIGKEKEG